MARSWRLRARRRHVLIVVLRIELRQGTFTNTNNATTTTTTTTTIPTYLSYSNLPLSPVARLVGLLHAVELLLKLPILQQELLKLRRVVLQIARVLRASCSAHSSPSLTPAA
ncbi:hypothetical protein E2C01_049180 [Portunus trituberculatus]|uniref:Uncharacterized protein n=1 Tax=Portunus trituberculatus TaxID=210409 RepID=A0A5B7GDI8_PORTR|nr:hypothetical protein [Portunus trituberculatus]